MLAAEGVPEEYDACIVEVYRGGGRRVVVEKLPQHFLASGIMWGGKQDDGVLGECFEGLRVEGRREHLHASFCVCFIGTAACGGIIVWNKKSLGAQVVYQFVSQCMIVVVATQSQSFAFGTAQWGKEHLSIEVENKRRVQIVLRFGVEKELQAVHGGGTF